VCADPGARTPIGVSGNLINAMKRSVLPILITLLE
jgi:hypothetical protein